MFTKSNAEDECGIAGAVRSVRCGAVNEGRKLVDRNHANEAPFVQYSIGYSVVEPSQTLILQKVRYESKR